MVWRMVVTVMVEPLRAGIGLIAARMERARPDAWSKRRRAPKTAAERYPLTSSLSASPKGAVKTDPG